MSPVTKARCAHCLKTFDESQLRELHGDLVCETCHFLTGAKTAAEVPDELPEQDGPRPVPEPPRRGEVAVGPVYPGRFSSPTAFFRDVDYWCEGRWWPIRLPLWLYFVYVWVQHVREPQYWCLFDGLNLGIHEFGHYLFGPFGDLTGAYGGSLLQCLVPVMGVLMFLRQRDYFAITIAFGWLATNQFDVAVYVGDAVAKRLQLVTPGGGEPIHDWNYILATLGWLRHTETLARLHWIAGHASMTVCVMGGAWVLWRMIRFRGGVRERDLI
jgi:hypothetical protein